MRYQKIHSQIWHDEKFKDLAGETQRLFLYLMSSPHSNAIGLYVIHKMYICADLNVSLQQLNKSVKELIKNGLIKYDEDVNLIFIVNHLRYNKIENENQSKGLAKIVETLPKSEIIQDVMKPLHKRYHKPLLQALQERYSKPETETETETEPEPETETVKKISVEEFVEGWNEICGSQGLDKIKATPPDRRKKIKLRLAEHKEYDFWESVLNKIPQVPFLIGKNDRGWKANIDWLIANDTNCVKILEGFYEHEGKPE